MSNRRYAMFAGAVLVAGLATFPVATADGGADDKLTGELVTGFRLVSVDGAESKYDQHVNLESGPRLYGLDLNYRPADGELGSLVDMVTVRTSNLGGDPYENVLFGLRKFGSYEFTYERRESTYVYEDIFFPEGSPLIDPSIVNEGDFQIWDFEREADIANLKIELTDRARLKFGFNRFTRTGDSDSVTDIERAEFILERPVEDSLNEYVAGFDYTWDRVILSFEERVRDYENDIGAFTAGRQMALSPSDPAVLDRYVFEQPYEYTSLQHSLRINARPNDKLILSGAVVFNDLDLDVDYSSDSSGIDFNDDPFTDSRSGVGEIERDVLMIEFDGSYLVNDDVAILFGVRQHEFDQEGAADFELSRDGTVQPDERGIGKWEYSIMGIEAGVQWQVSPQVSLTGGIRYEEREVDEIAIDDRGGTLDVEEEPDTDQTGYFVNVGWNPSANFTLTADAETSDYDDPFTLTSPDDRQRYRVTARYRADTGFWASGNVLYHDQENSVSGWEADWSQLRVDVGYMTDDLSVAGGYALIDAEREISQLVTPSFGPQFLFPVSYETDIDQFTGSLRWRVADQWIIGGEGYYYTADETWEQDWTDIRCFAEYEFTQSYFVRLGVRQIDYEETLRGFNDYDADIADVQVGYRF